MITSGLKAIAGFTVATAVLAVRAETFDSLTARLPDAANAIVLIDVEQIMAAPLAEKEGWTRKLETAYVERPVYLPPEAEKLALGAVLRPHDDFLATWEIAVMDLAEPVSVRSIARSEAGYVDKIGDVSAAITPTNAGFLQLKDRLLAVVHPADRQFMARWAASEREGAPSQLSPYLQSAVGMVSDRAQVVLAVDLTDVLSMRDIEEALADATWLGTDQNKKEAIAAVLSRLRGAALRLAVGQQCLGLLQVDFDVEVKPLGSAAKPLVMQALDKLGVSTAELEDWRVKLDGKSIRMQGIMSNEAQRRVFSVIELPNVELSAEYRTADQPADAGPNEARDRSLAYFKSTEVLVDDLRKGLKQSKATSSWLERYARRIDELPVLHVDDELLDYGDKLAEQLRIMSLSKREAGIRYGVRASQGGGYYDGYSYGTDAYTRAAERSQAKREEMAVAQDTHVQGWKLIDDATADIRRKMTKKFSVEF